MDETIRKSKDVNFYKKQVTSPINRYDVNLEGKTTHNTTQVQSKNTTITIDNISKGTVNLNEPDEIIEPMRKKSPMEIERDQMM